MEKYRKIKVVGKGNFGHAVLVQSNIDHKYYIMKIIDVSKMDHKQKQEAVTEVRVLKTMRHPFIVTYRESFMDKNRCLCIVMDYADGGDLYTKIAQQKKLGKYLDENIILDWFLQLCLALKHIHSNRILHRDLKTQNIFLTSKGEVKIGDFGIARVLQNTYDCAQTAIGTPYYLSPEICQEKPYNQKSDIWSLGCILYEMLTLRHAFDANSMKGLVLKILKGTFPPIPSCYSKDIQGVVTEMLTKDPAKRPSIRQILDKPFLKTRINNLIVTTMAKYEMANNVKAPKAVADAHPKVDVKLGPKAPVERVASGLLKEESAKKRVELVQKSMPKLHVPPQQPSAGERIPMTAGGRKITEKNQPKELEESKETISIPDGDDDEGENYSVLINSLKNIVNGKKGEGKDQSEDEYFVEEEKDRVYANKHSFLTPEGKRIPGLSDKDSITYRIEALKVYLEQQLGCDTFFTAYKHLQGSETEEETNVVLKKLLGKTKVKFLPLLYQLIVCEDTCYTVG